MSTTTESGLAAAPKTTGAVWLHSTALCYHEPRVHDHELYFQLARINLFVLLPVALLGLFFNASALICLYRPPKITSGVFIYLKALLILDHCQLLVTTAGVLLPQLCDRHHSPHHTLYTACQWQRRLLTHTMPRLEMTVNLLHVWTIAALSAHRYWKISRPMLSRLKDTVQRARLSLVFLLLIGVVFRLPVFLFELQIKTKPRFMIAKRLSATEFLSPYRLLYHSLLDPLLSHVAPFAWMCVFSLLTLREIFQSRDFAYKQISFESSTSTKGGSCRQMRVRRQPLRLGLRKRSEVVRAKQELRATVSIVLIILLYLVFHTLQLYHVGRKWQLLMTGQCPTRSDYLQSYIGNVLSMVSASVNAFVFIAFTNRLRRYFRMLIRKTSRTMSQSSEPPLSPKGVLVATSTAVDTAASIGLIASSSSPPPPPPPPPQIVARPFLNGSHHYHNSSNNNNNNMNNMNNTVV